MPVCVSSGRYDQVDGIMSLVAILRVSRVPEAIPIHIGFLKGPVVSTIRVSQQNPQHHRAYMANLYVMNIQPHCPSLPYRRNSPR
jgi:hypothetical protein